MPLVLYVDWISFALASTDTSYIRYGYGFHISIYYVSVRLIKDFLLEKSRTYDSEDESATGSDRTPHSGLLRFTKFFDYITFVWSNLSKLKLLLFVQKKHFFG